MRFLLRTLLTIWLVVTISFVALRLLPGNAIDAQLAGSGLPEEVISARKAAVGLDKPVPLQYLHFLANVLRGELGSSLYDGRTVQEAIWQNLPPTAGLAGLSLLFALLIGVGLGVVGGVRLGMLSRLSRLLTNASFAIPFYWTATLALFLFTLVWIRQYGQTLLPALVLGFHSAGAIARVIQVEIQQNRAAAFIITAQAKGLPNPLISWRHLLRISLLPAITVAGLQAGILFSGTVITESIFSRPGLGQLLLTAVLERDYPIVQGVVLLIAIFYITINTAARWFTVLIDPRLSAL